MNLHEQSALKHETIQSLPTACAEDCHAEKSICVASSLWAVCQAMLKTKFRWSKRLRHQVAYSDDAALVRLHITNNVTCSEG